MSSAQKNGIKRMVYASSAAIYGEPSQLPLTEDVAMTQLSPYGLEKAVNEQYGELFYNLYNFSSLGQRFFNVYGPRQDPKSPYAGVIALFVDKISNHEAVTVNGDGENTRDFIFIEDVARANVAALECNYQGACNIATGKKTSLLDLISTLSDIAGHKTEIKFAPPRTGDIVHSLASPERMNLELGIVADTLLSDGLTALIKYQQRSQL
jgi:UDP-glucose 4-epimerase